MSNLRVQKCSKNTYTNINTIPKNRVGLLLGTVKTLSSGYQNLYYKYRINATVALYKSNKINAGVEMDYEWINRKSLVRQAFSRGLADFCIHHFYFPNMI